MLCLIFAFHKRDGFFLCVKSNGKSPPRDRKKALKGSFFSRRIFFQRRHASKIWEFFNLCDTTKIESRIKDSREIKAACITWQQRRTERKKKLKARKKAGRVFLLLMDARKTNSKTENKIHHIHIHGRTKDFNQWWRRNLKYHVSRRRGMFRVRTANKHTEKQPKRSRFLLCWYQITKQYRLIIIYSQFNVKLKVFFVVMKEASCCFLFLSRARLLDEKSYKKRMNE